jgi:hypothetical protein
VVPLLLSLQEILVALLFWQASNKLAVSTPSRRLIAHRFAIAVVLKLAVATLAETVPQPQPLVLQVVAVAWLMLLRLRCKRERKKFRRVMMKAITTIGEADYQAANLKRRKKRTSKQSRQEFLDPVSTTHSRSGNGGDFRSFSSRRSLCRGLKQLFKPLYVFKKPTCVYTHRKYWHSKVQLWFQGKACMVLGSCPKSPD